MAKVTGRQLKILKDAGADLQCKAGHDYEVLYEDEWYYRICQECLVREPLTVQAMINLRALEGCPNIIARKYHVTYTAIIDILKKEGVYTPRVYKKREKVMK